MLHFQETEMWSRKNLRISYNIKPYSRNTAQVERKTKSDTGSKRGDWDNLKVIHKIPEQRTRKREIKELQKTAILGTAHIPRKVLM